MGTKWNVDSNGNLKLAGNIEDQSSNISVDINNRILYANDGSTINLNWQIPGTVNFNGANLTNIGSISPSVPIAPNWVNVTSSSVNLVNNYNYAINYGTSVTCLLPSTSAFGSEIKICDILGNGFVITQPVGVYVITKVGNTTTGISGGIQSTGYGSSLYIVCVVPNMVWQIINSEGVFSIT